MPRQRRAKGDKPKHPPSRFGWFMGVHEIRSAGLVEASGVSRQHIYRLRYGLMDPTRLMMVNMAAALVLLYWEARES